MEEKQNYKIKLKEGHTIKYGTEIYAYFDKRNNEINVSYELEPIYEEPKYGDIIAVYTSPNKYTICIFAYITESDYEEEGENASVNAIAQYNPKSREFEFYNGESRVWIGGYEHIRPATDEEKKMLLDELLKHNYSYDEERHLLRNIAPKRSGTDDRENLYFYIDFDELAVTIKKTRDNRTPKDERRYALRNYFKDKTEAVKVATEIKNFILTHK